MKITNLHKSYDNKEVLKGISFEVKPNELLIIIGESGCGKSTLIKCINHMHTFDSGSIEIPTKTKTYVIPSGTNKYKDDIDLKRNIGYVHQNAGLLPHLTAWQNIKLPSEISKTKFDEDYARELIKRIHLTDDLLNKRPCQLSGGEKQRVGIVRALVQKPDLLLLDEPFSALDPLVRYNLQHELINLKGTTTMIMVTHDMTEACILADRLVLLHNGVIEQIGTPTELKLHPVSEYVSNYIGNTKSVKLYYKSWRSAALDVMDDNHIDSIELTDEEGKVLKSITRSQVIKSLEDHPGNLESLLYV